MIENFKEKMNGCYHENQGKRNEIIASLSYSASFSLFLQLFYGLYFFPDNIKCLFCVGELPIAGSGILETEEWLEKSKGRRSRRSLTKLGSAATYEKRATRECK